MVALLSPAGGPGPPTLVRGGTVVEAGRTLVADVRIRDGRVAELGRLEPADGERVLDAAGCLVLPGAVDLHVHLADDVGGVPIADGIASGTAAAVAGGVTTVVTFATQRPGETVRGALERMEAAARGRCRCHVGLHLTPTGDAWDWAEIDDAIAHGFRSLKLYTTYRRAGIYSSYVRIEDAMRRLAGRDALLLVHCEDEGELSAAAEVAVDPTDARDHGRLRPPRAELVAVERIAAAAAHTGCRTHIVHVSTPDAARRIAAARADGVPVTAETCPQYLLLDERRLAPPDGHRMLCTPPPRPEADRAALEQRFLAGDLDLLATDHCPFSRADKDLHRADFRRVPTGLPGVGGLLQLAWEVLVVRGGRPPTELVERVAAAPARALGLDGRKGTLAPGADADLVVVRTVSDGGPVVATLADAWSPWTASRCRLEIRAALVGGADAAPR